ncbi:unnamed protein product, partial [Rotaria sordida]
MIRLLSVVIVFLTFIYAIECSPIKSPKACSPVKCSGKPKQCAYGYQKKDGCEICRCNDPCNPPGKPILCGPKQRCFIEKKPDGTFEGRCGDSSKTSHKGKKIETGTSKGDCNSPKVTGPCRAAFPRFHYNSATRSCESFVYGGCGGNKNNFRTKAECAPIEKTITGKVTHTGPNTIDKNSKVQIQLRDVSLMDAASKLIASTTINDAKIFPISYKLKYNPSDIKPHHTYAISATINGPDQKLSFINDVRTTADLTRSASPTIDVAVIRVGGSSDSGAAKPNPDKKCGPVKCPGKQKQCPYGYQKKDGCEICRCNDPCNPPGKGKLCGSKQRCFVDKKPDGTFEARCGTSPTKTPTESKDDKKNVS